MNAHQETQRPRTFEDVVARVRRAAAGLMGPGDALVAERVSASQGEKDRVVTAYVATHDDQKKFWLVIAQGLYEEGEHMDPPTVVCLDQEAIQDLGLLVAEAATARGQK